MRTARNQNNNTNPNLMRRRPDANSVLEDEMEDKKN